MRPVRSLTRHSGLNFAACGGEMTLPAHPEPLVSIIIPVFNLWDYTLRCLMSVLKHTAHIPHEVIVVDDASTDETAVGLPLLNGIRLIRNERNRGFSHNNNLAAAVARGKHLVFLNNDTEVHARWLDEMLSALESSPTVGMVGSKLLFPDGTIQHAGVAFAYGAPDPISPFHIHYHQPASVSTSAYELNAVTAACALMPRELFLSLGGFDEEFRMGYEDVDLCLRVRAAGWKIVYTPRSVVTHYESLSPGRFVGSRRNIERLHQKWLGKFDTFEADYRTLKVPPTPGPARAPCAVIVAVHDDLGTIAPCLHNLLLDLREEDELIVVDDGSVGATATFLRLFAEQHAGRAQLLRHETHAGLAAAWRSGLQACKRPYAVAVLATLRVQRGWLDRLIGHATAQGVAGAVTVAMDDGWRHRTAPFSAAEGGPGLPSALPSGDLAPVASFSAPVIAAPTDRLLALVQRHPHGVPGGDPRCWPRALAEMGLSMGLARDVTPYSFCQVFPSSSAAARATYHDAVARELEEPTADGFLVSVVVVLRETADVALAMLKALLRNTRHRFELIMVEAGSEAGMREALVDELERTRGANLSNVSFIDPGAFVDCPTAINHGLAEAQGEVIVVMNGDVLATPGWLVRLLALLQVAPTIGVVAPTSNVGPRPQTCQLPNALAPPLPLDAFAQEWATKVLGDFGGMPRVSGICMAIRRAVLDVVGGFDSRYGDAGGDVEDFCLRTKRAGFIVALAREAYVEHLGHSSPRWLDLHPRRNPAAGWLRFCERWNHPPEWCDADGLARVFDAGTPFEPTSDRVALPPRRSHPVVATGEARAPHAREVGLPSAPSGL